MSFVATISELISDQKTTDIKNKIERTVSEIREHEKAVKEHIDSNYVEFLPNIMNTEKLFEEGDDLLGSAKNLLNSLQSSTDGLQLTDSVLEKYSITLTEVLLASKVSMKLLKIHNLFQLVEKKYSSSNAFLKLIDILAKIHACLNDPADNILPNLDCYAEMKNKYHVENEKVLDRLNTKFKELVQFIEKPFQKTTSVTIKITKDEIELNEVITALMKSKYNPRKLCSFLMSSVFMPIATKPISLEFDASGDDFFILQLSYSSNEINDPNLRPNYKTVFKNLSDTFKCLEAMNIVLTENKCIFSIIGDQLKSQFCNLLIRDCLSFSLPDTIEEMENSTIVQDIHTFNAFLNDVYFINGEDDNALDLYAAKIEILFLNKFCSNVLGNAVQIMKKDLHDMILVGEDEVVKSSSTFPSCMVSKSVLELKNLLDKIISEAKHSKNEELADRLITTVYTILDSYIIEVPRHHEKLLLKIPQQTALFHNNCLFLAYWVEQNANNDSFIDLAKSLQDKGTEFFLNQLDNQQNQVMEILQGFDLQGHVGELCGEQQKLIKQCLRQFDLLKNVWQTVLPDSVYKKSIGSLINTYCTDLIRRIFTLEDITATTCTGLVNILDLVIKKGPTLYKNTIDINVDVKCWQKLKQLYVILNSSLVQIVEQWADGKGTLTLNFKAEEIKHLIRALFQNTDRRAHALNTII